MTVGIAILARNAAHDLPQAIGPFIGWVDQIAILLGGKSTDDTPALAAEYTARIADYAGPIDDYGGLLDFGAARQQSFDLLETDYALLVDCDDRWQSVENLGSVVSDAQAGGYEGVLFPYDLGASRFLQTRLFKRTAGRWVSPVHELFKYDNPATKTLTVNALTIKQDKPVADRLAGIKRNIRIAEAHLSMGIDFRLLRHIAHEYLTVGEYSKALGATERFLNNQHRAEVNDLTPDKLFQVHYTRGFAYLCLEEFHQAAASAMMALSYARYGQAWTLLAEAANMLGVYDLALCAADNALAFGQPIDAIPAPLSNVTSVPYHLKAKALAALGRKHEAIVALTLGQRLGGGKDMDSFKFQLCEELGVIP